MAVLPSILGLSAGSLPACLLYQAFCLPVSNHTFRSTRTAFLPLLTTLPPLLYLLCCEACLPISIFVWWCVLVGQDRDDMEQDKTMRYCVLGWVNMDRHRTGDRRTVWDRWAFIPPILPPTPAPTSPYPTTTFPLPALPPPLPLPTPTPLPCLPPTYLLPTGLPHATPFPPPVSLLCLPQMLPSFLRGFVEHTQDISHSIMAGIFLCHGWTGWCVHVHMLYTPACTFPPTPTTHHYITPAGDLICCVCSPSLSDWDQVCIWRT